MKMIKRAMRIAAVFLALFVLSHASRRGVLFPWSPVQPGYAAETFPGATIVYPAQHGMPDAYRDAPAILAEGFEQAVRTGKWPRA
jgi:hypothetical protein